MPSKYTAYVHLSQADMDKLVKIDPSINENDGNINKIIAILFRNLIDGKYTTKEQQTEMNELKKQKMKEEITYLKIKSKIALVHDLHIPPDKVHDVIEKKIPIEQVIGQTYDSPTKNVSDISPYDEKNKRLECMDCGVLFEIHSNQLHDLLDAQSRYLSHKYDKHGAILK